MNEEPGFTDEVVMIFVDSEIVDDLLILLRGDALDFRPFAVDGFGQFARFQASGVDPVRFLVRGALDPEGMGDGGAQRGCFAGDAQLDLFS